MKYYGKVKYISAGKGFWTFIGVEPHVMIKMKSVFQHIKKTSVCPFNVNHNREFATDLKWFLDRYPMEMTEEDRVFMTNERNDHVAHIDKLSEIFSADYKPSDIMLKKPIRHYQAAAVDFFHGVKRYLLGDVVGLGKTITAIGSLKKETLPAIVIVQTHLPIQWKEKIEEFSDLKAHIVKNGPVYALPPADIYLFKYSQVTKWVDVLVNGFIKTVIFDEVQELRRSESDKYISSKKIADAAEYVCGMSATPVYNYGDEIWNIMNIIKGHSLGSIFEFQREWCKDGREVSDPKALGSFLRSSNLFLRRTRSDVKMELPVINKIVECIGHDEEEIEKVEDLARSLSMKVLSGTFVERGQATRELDMLIRHATGVSKAKYIAQYVRMLVESGEPVLLALWHRDVYDIVNKELVDLKPVMYTGSETPNQKEESKRMFIAGESNLMMISLRSGIGLDGLQLRSSIVVIGELDWSPQVHEQLIGRLNRDGQPEQVTAIYLISDDGSDPGIVELLGLKSSQSSGIIDPFGSPDEYSSDESRVKNLAKKFLESRAS